MTEPARTTDAAALREALLAVVRERGYRYSETPFVLSSGGTSHDYVDLRRAFSAGADLRLAAQALLARLEAESLAFEALGGMTMGADPIAHAVAVLTGCDWYSVRKADKSHGSRQRVEGAELGPGTRVVVFEDTVTTGRSVLEALEVVESTGAEVVGAATVLDRGDAATPAFAARGIPYLALLTYRDLGIDPIGTAHSEEAAGSAT